MNNSTLIPVSDYSSDQEVLALMDEDGWQAKWGGPLGTQTTLTYSFAEAASFNLDNKYIESFNDIFNINSSRLNELLQNPLYEFKSYSESEKSFVRESFSKWSDATGIEFIEINETFTDYGDIRFFKQNFSEWSNILSEPYNTAAAFAFVPIADYWGYKFGGDVFIDTVYSYGDGYYETIVTHELGHSIGLSHPFDGYINVDLKTHESVMTYDQNYYLSDSPMPADIKAAEFLYGGNNSANIGNDTYSWDINYEYRTSVIDDGGTDTYDFSNQNNGVYVDISPDSWSNITDYGLLTNDSSIYQYGQLYTSPGTYIENIIATNYSDVISDNTTSNTINALAGDDVIFVSSGTDFVNGGNGNDTLNVSGQSSNYYCLADPSQSNLYSLLGIDDLSATPILWMEDIEYLQFDDTLTSPEQLENNQPNVVKIISETSSSLEENTDINEVVYLTIADSINNETLVYSLLESDDASYFSIDSESGAVKLNSPSDYETKSSYSFSVKAEASSGYFDTQDIEISIIDIDEVPLITSPAEVDIFEGVNVDEVIYQLTYIGDFNDIHSLSLSGEDASYVIFDTNNGEVRFQNIPDFEDKQFYNFDITVSDQGGLSDTKAVTVNILNINEAPVITSGSSGVVDENSETSTVIYSIEASDSEGTQLTYSLSGKDASYVHVDDLGQVRLLVSADYELKNQYNFDVIASDGELSSSKNVSINISNLDEPPVITSGIATSYTSYIPRNTNFEVLLE